MNLSSHLFSQLGQLGRRAWSVKQPLIKRPTYYRSAVSDLFVWRKGVDWRTYFQLTDIASLFSTGLRRPVESSFAGGEEISEIGISHCKPQLQSFSGGKQETSEYSFAKIFVFNKSGQVISVRHVDTPRYSRSQIEISEFAKSCPDNIGTFCVLHANTPNTLVNLGSHLTERGYVSYSYQDTPLQSYVHGNLDAVAEKQSGLIELLAGTSFLKREYRLQHVLENNRLYELAVVNASNKFQTVELELQKLETRLRNIQGVELISHSIASRKCKTQQIELGPGACHVFKVHTENYSTRAIIRSKLVMMRPLVFSVKEGWMDAFHG